MNSVVVQKQFKKNTGIPMALPRSPIPLNPFGSLKKRSESKADDPLQQLEEVKNPQNMHTGEVPQDTKKDTDAQLIYLDTEQVEIINTEQNEPDQKLRKVHTICEVLQEEDTNTGGFEDGRKTKAYYARFLLIDQAVSSFSFLSIVIAVLEYDLEFAEREDFIAQAMLWMTFILTIGMILLTIVRFQAKLEWLKTRKVMSDKSNLITSGYLKPMIIEIIISAVHPMPWTWKHQVPFFNEPTQAKAYYHVNEILLLFMLLRVLLIIRTLLMMSVWYNNRTQRVCTMYACEADYLFVIKCIMKNQPYMLVTSAMVISIFYFGFAVRICESPLQRYGNCLWYIIVTMTTVGYGDYYAQTQLGRFVVFFVCIWGVFIVSMMVITLNTTLTIIPLEAKAIAVLERLQLKGEMKQHAATVLTLLGRIGMAHRKDLFHGELKKKYFWFYLLFSETQIKLRNALNSFKIAQRQYRSIGDENISEEMGRQFDFLRDDLKEIFKKQNALLETNIQLMQHMKIDQHQIEYYAQNLSRSSFQQLILNKEDKNPESSNFKISQNALLLAQRPKAYQEEILEKISENEDAPIIIPSE